MTCEHSFIRCWPAVLLLAALCACSGRPTPLKSEIIARGSATEIGGSGERFEVIGSQGELQDLYAALHAGRLPKPEAPVIDFSRSLVVFVAMAQQPSAGYGVELASPRLQGSTLVITTTFHSPPRVSFRATVLTRPFAVMRVERPPKLEAVEFRAAAGEVLDRISVNEKI